MVLFINYLHQKYRHCSTTQTLVYYRQYCWTPKLRPLVSSVVRKCVVCRILRAKTLPRPPPPCLPLERVRCQRAFECVGVDNTGSFPVQGTIEGRRYLTLFVCTATRYIHVEISASLSTEDFLCALRRFSALYGVPSTILSDNGRNFVGAQRSLAEAVKTPDVDSYLREHEIRWKFQTPLSPWKGGHFE